MPSPRGTNVVVCTMDFGLWSRLADRIYKQGGYPIQFDRARYGMAPPYVVLENPAAVVIDLRTGIDVALVQAKLEEWARHDSGHDVGVIIVSPSQRLEIIKGQAVGHPTILGVLLMQDGIEHEIDRRLRKWLHAEPTVDS